jgi:HAE1 family hydrophobic/amphiphilic exporter-1
MRATGSSALGNKSISTGAAGGMLTGVVLGVFFIPVLFIIFQYLQEKVTGAPKPVSAPATDTPYANAGEAI